MEVEDSEKSKSTCEVEHEDFIQEERDCSCQTEHALTNPLILREIFRSLGLKTLLNCSLVNRIWNFEARCFIRDFRPCLVVISGKSPCIELKRLNAALERMNPIPFNGLSINLTRFRRSYTPCCEPEDLNACFGNILNDLPVKHLSFVCLSSFEYVMCSAALLVSKLLENTDNVFITLKLPPPPVSSCKLQYLLPQHLWLPKLRIFDIGSGHGWARGQRALLRILEAAPNLEKITGVLSPSLLQVIPVCKYFLIDAFRLQINSDLDRVDCLKLSRFGPPIRALHAGGSVETEGPFFWAYCTVFARLLRTSQASLEELILGVEPLPLHQLPFAPLVNLKKLTIVADETNASLWSSVRRIAYQELLPSVESVRLRAKFDDYDSDDDALPEVDVDPVDDEELNILEANVARSVFNLKLEVAWSLTQAASLTRVFPCVRVLQIIPSIPSVGVQFFEELWTLWPNLSELEVSAWVGSESHLYDAAFCGLHRTEVESLRVQSDEFLQTVQVAPVRPAVTTMLYLKRLHIRIGLLEDWVEGQQVFLSRVTGHVALKRMPELQVTISCPPEFDDEVMAHLSSFATITREE